MQKKEPQAGLLVECARGQSCHAERYLEANNLSSLCEYVYRCKTKRPSVRKPKPQVQLLHERLQAQKSELPIYAHLLHSIG